MTLTLGKRRSFVTRSQEAMPSTKEIWNQDLEELIRQKPFEMLSVEERASVLIELEADEYRRLRETALMASRYLERPIASPHPRPEIRTELHQRLKKRRSLGRRIGKVLDHRMPVWQVAAAAVVLVLMIQLGGKSRFSGAGAANGPLFADSTLHDSAVQPVWDPEGDTSFFQQGKTDTL